MPEVESLTYNHKELTQLMLEHRGIREGQWMIFVKFKFAGTNVGLSESEALPAAIVGIESVGIQRITEPSALSVDASDVVKKRRRQKATRP